MTEREERFQVGSQPRVVARAGSADVWVREGEAGTIEVTLRGSGAEAFRIEQIGDEVRITEERHRRFDSGVRIGLTVPTGTELDAATASGDLHADVSLAVLRAGTASGDIRASAVTGDCNVRTGSGDVSLGMVDGRLRVLAASGDVGVDRVTDASVQTASGDVTLREAVGEARAKSASGDVTVRSFTGTELEVGTVSGDISVGMPRGRRVELQLSTLSGRVRLPDAKPAGAASGQAEARVAAKSVSGDIVIERL